MKEILRYRDLEEAGWGSRTTVWRKVRAGQFPAPVDDGSGNPVWFREMLEQHKSECRPFSYQDNA